MTASAVPPKQLRPEQRRPDQWGDADDPGLMARLVGLQVVAGQQLEDIADGHGVALGDYLVLAVIRRSSDGVCAPSTICKVLRRTSGGMTLTLDRLVSAGWITREPDPHDRRRVLLRLTTSGMELAVAVNESLHEWERALVGRRQLDEIIGVLDELLGLLEPVQQPSTSR
jgi:DNA-binding MarR family transcriptional regulator